MSESSTQPTPIPSRSGTRSSSYRDLRVIYEGSSEEIPVRVPDLSSDGMFINTPREYPQGAVLKVSFHLVRTNFDVQARAEVRYCLPGVGIGVQFVDIAEETRQAIEEELRM